jgi:outer membrane receptor for ferrienterochelin and colicin
MKRIVLVILLMMSVSAQAQTLSDTLALTGSAVVAQKNLVKMDVDKITYKVEDDVDSKTSTVLEMLRKVPMVSVDAQDKITVNGSSSFLIYVDGKPNSMLSSNPSQILKLMPASAVKSIEVVTNPGAKYDAEGVGGVLNIITDLSGSGGKSSLDGQYANLALQGNTRGYGGGLYYSMQKGKWAFNLNGNASNTYNYGAISDMERMQKYEGAEYITTTSGEADVKSPLYIANINLSYDVDSLNLISIGVGYMGNVRSTESSFDAVFKNPYMEYGYAGTVLSGVSASSIMANADYQHIWAGYPDRSLVFSYQFSATPTHAETSDLFDAAASQTMGLVDRKVDGKTNSLSHIAQVDFTTPIGAAAGHVFNTGAKYIARHNSSYQDNFIFDGNDYVYTEEGGTEYDFYNDIGAVYAEYDGKFGSFGMKAGVRYEHTWQTIRYAGESGFGLDYGSLVPVASLQYNIGMQQNIGLSYNMRISRPGITYLNPYVDNVSDPTARTFGNPELEAERGHALSLVYNYFSSRWISSVTLRQSFTGNGISQYSFYDDEHILNTTYGNVISTSVSGLDVFASWIPGQKTRVIFNGGVSYTDIASAALGQSNRGWSYTSLIGLQQTLPWDLRFSVNAIASGRTISLQGWTSGLCAATFGLTKSFLEDRLTFSLSGVTHLKKGRMLKLESVSVAEDFISRTTTGIPLRMMQLSVSYSFGKQGDVNVKRSRKTIEADSQLNVKSASESLGTMMGK